MILPLTLSLSILVVTILIHGFGTSWWVSYIYRKHQLAELHNWNVNKGFYILSFTAVFLLMLHFMEIVVWAVVYMLIPEIHQLRSFEEAIYFSMVTYATLGYGDITLGPRWRLMSGFEAMNGILLFGWSTALFFSAVQRILGKSISNSPNKK